jgi:hypothetical protein
MALPANVEDQAKKAADLQKQLVEGKTGEGVNTPEGAPPQQNADPAPANEKPGEELNPPENQNQPAEVVQNQNQPTPQENWEGMYKALQGKYNAEIPPLQNQNRVLTGQVELQQNDINRLKNTIDGLNQQIEELKTSKPSTKEEKPAQLDAAAIGDTYGSEFGAMAQMLNDLMAQPKPQQPKEEVKENVPQANEAPASDPRMVAHWNAIKQQVPNAVEINNDPGFSQWLWGVNQKTGRIRMVDAEEAHRAFNSAAIIGFFKDYITEQQSPGQQDNMQQMEPLNPAPQQQLFENAPVSPDRGVPAPNAQNPVQNLKYYTKAEVNQFFKKLATGELKLLDPNVKATRDDIMMAGPQGRIVENLPLQ